MPELTDLIERDIKKATSVTKKWQAEIFTGDRGLRTAYEILLGGYNNNNNNNNNTIDLVKSGTNRLSSTNSAVKKVPTPSQGMRSVIYFVTFIDMMIIILLLLHFIQDCINFRNQGRT